MQEVYDKLDQLMTDRNQTVVKEQQSQQRRDEVNAGTPGSNTKRQRREKAEGV